MPAVKPSVASSSRGQQPASDHTSASSTQSETRPGHGGRRCFRGLQQDFGGIKRANLPQVLAAGARRVVIVSDLLTAGDIQAATREAAAIADCGFNPLTSS